VGTCESIGRRQNRAPSMSRDVAGLFLR